MYSHTFQRMVVKEIGRSLPSSDLESFLLIGMTSALRHAKGVVLE